MRRLLLLLFSGVLAAAGLAAPASASFDTNSHAQGGSTSHWIGIRSANGVGEFFDRRTGERFVPRGANYLKLYSAADGTRFDALLDPSRFDPAAIRADLQAMTDLGYNTTRVFLDICRFECIGSSKGLNPKVLDNLAALLRLAKEVGIVVLPTVNEIDAFFSYKANLPCCKYFEGSFNRLFLTSEGLKAARNYYTDVIQGLKKRQAPLEVVLAWGLRNELFLDAELPAFSLRFGRLRTGNGKTYASRAPRRGGAWPTRTSSSS